MRHAAIPWCSVALLFCAADAQAPDPLAAAYRDAQHLADCTRVFDAKCAAPFYDAKSYELLDHPSIDPKNLARDFDTLKRTGVKYTQFETRPPHDLFEDGGARVYAFVPYTRTIEIGDRTPMTNWFFIALSADGGATWQFVDAEG